MLGEFGKKILLHSKAGKQMHVLYISFMYHALLFAWEKYLSGLSVGACEREILTKPSHPSPLKSQMLSPKCNKGPKCNTRLVLNVIKFGPKCNKPLVLNIIYPLLHLEPNIEIYKLECQLMRSNLSILSPDTPY